MKEIVKDLNIKLNLKGDFDISKSDVDNFREFFLKNKTLIYKNVYKIFNRLLKTEEKTLLLTIVSTLNDVSSETIFRYGVQDRDMLMNDVIPYFESIEDYEMCSKTVRVYKKLCQKKL